MEDLKNIISNVLNLYIMFIIELILVCVDEII